MSTHQHQPYNGTLKLPTNFGEEGYEAEHRGYQLLLTETIMMSATVVILGLRLFTRLYILGKLHSDDYWIVLASICMIALTAVHGVGIKYGIGKHVYDIDASDSNKALIMAYVGQLLYVAAIGCVKISLLLFLQRVFPLAIMRRVVRGVLLFVLCFTVTNIFLFAFQCDTPEYYFEKSKGVAKEDEGVCLEPQVVYYPMAAINIVTDVVIWVLPVPTVLRARLSRKEKWGLLWVFILGGIAVAAAVVRPFNLRDVMEEGDPTWQIVTVSAWAMIEISVGIMCASIPAIKPLILRVAPRLLLSTGDGSSSGGITYRNEGVPHGNRHSSHHSRHRSHGRDNEDFALHSIKVTKDVEFQVEEADANEYHESSTRRNGSTVPAGFGLGAPRVERHFDAGSVVDVVVQQRKHHEEPGTFLDMGSPSGSRGRDVNQSDESLVGRSQESFGVVTSRSVNVKGQR
ncbi:hypothetical protein BJ508DRAFT_331906 [Ascobolus immersus RN42]|uniref:Rhodopsin domain-containing protein n=1 Tax=Ascobolus immersus RN42 TaxID=1160509 RepID=A0A3N4HP35_ASCIM|nr:hypothetical protein BJ508DRAFT_331906 [Ascobolus immersus RN42]